jgi:hypothetical protein
MKSWKLSTLALLGALAVSHVAPADAADKSPHMRGALVNLKAARSQLEKAEPDSPGRARALELVNQAIVEVEKGVQ